MHMDHGKIVLITGANKGIGFETARQFGKLGYRVLLGARDGERGNKAVESLMEEGIDAQLLVLDVTNQATIDHAVRFIEDKYGYLDILINNAGIFLEKGVLPSQLTMATLRETFEVNFFGVFAVTTALLPLLKKSAAGRIVNVSSGQGSLTRSSSPDATRLQLAYNSSKAAVNALTIQFAKELRETPIKINAAAPGYTITDMNGGKGNRTVQEASTVIVRLALLDETGSSGGYFEDAGEIPW
ncbi:SDR family oxidoreductase [Microbacter margulisiae]|uniref:NAD(P)-dependent dehydrogenase (Short-subunit alcohol dehydrogenase family) n=1 Tax=Microbacter margulisiae TaxID=1350067 RepID=A0A7W5H115_9PORP|nr:SDR family oxidoreductase [Microbacter margulisiae]MBB3186245.1 NAD(P)-dependent dehydrogenase (short-subunit alcohol dehydrogenase family) [Microbacter margulisiae]